MFVVEVGSALTTALFVHALASGKGEAPPGFILAVSLWLWFTVLFANFAEAMAEGRGKAQADTLRKARKDIAGEEARRAAARRAPSRGRRSSTLRKGDVVLVEAGDYIPGDGEVVEGVASVDESAITGESAPVIRESGGDRSAVTGGTRVLSDWLIVRITAEPRRDLPRPHDLRWSRAPSARRRRTRSRSTSCSPALTIIFLLACVTLLPFSLFSVTAAGQGTPGHDHRARRAARLPDPDDDRRAALGDRHRRHGPHDPGERDRDVGPRGRGGRRRRRAAARQDRHDHARQPPGHRVPPGATASPRRSSPTPRSSPRSPTRRPRAAASSCSRRRSIGLRERDVHELGATFVPFTAQTRMSGVDLDGRADPQGRRRRHRRATSSRIGGAFPPPCARPSSDIAKQGGTPLVVADGRATCSASSSSRTS